MRLDRSELSKAVQTALSLGAVAAVGVAGTAFAQTATTTQNNQKQPQTLQTIVVTGSHIRRVDLETSNPVVAVSAQQIKASGKQTLGDIIQNLPEVTGAPTNPRVNNGGGAGASTADLRGLGSSRTLVLVNGQRVINDDLNAIPAELVERVEVLNGGGATAYGSDAIGGVVNIILKQNYQGAEFSTNYGISDRDDGARKGASFIFGQTSDKGSILAGISYNKQDGILSGARAFSKYATYLYYGAPTNLGSGRTPFGKIKAPSAKGVCSSGAWTLQSGDGSSMSDYRCFNNATDTYNYQLTNLDLTPQERTNAFFEGTYHLTDNVDAYADVFYNTTTSNSALAALPFDSTSDAVTVSRYSMYNPFGVDFGPPGTNGTTPDNPLCPTAVNPNAQCQYQMQTRWTAAGQRESHFRTNTAQGIFGLKGSIGTWNWDANFNYGHIGQSSIDAGDFAYNAAFKNAVGPSMLVNGVPTCVSTPNDASTAIAGCVPLNIFNVTDPAQVNLQRAYQIEIFKNTLGVDRAFNVGANGPLFSLPAGQVQLAVGADYRKEYTNLAVDSIAVLDPNTAACGVPQSACSSPERGGFNVKEAYAELYIPILQDLPFFKHLSLDLGDRYSKYSLAGSTNNWKVAVEWRPIDDLLLRGTVQQVFRAPTIGDLFAGPAGSAPQFVDPCIGLTATQLATHANACQNVPAGYVGTGEAQTTSLITGSEYAGLALKPEFGKTFDWGAVYSPHFVPGLTVTADLWRVYLNNLISAADPQSSMNICFNNDSSPYCKLIYRTSSGDIHYILAPTQNYGRLDTSGVDASFTYAIPQVGWLPGRFELNGNYTYLARYDMNLAPGTSQPVQHLAGLYNKSFGNFSRNRAQLAINWQDGPWTASWRTRWIGRLNIGSTDLAQGESADYALKGVVLPVPSMVYNDLSVGYNVQPLNTSISVGVDNLFDKQPPMMYQNNVLNADTDVNTYDTIGRYYWGRITVKF